jgi:ABC-type Mn2+/Zn2+ transport system ATPase subunit
VDELIGRWREAGITVLVASHAIERVMPLLDGSVRLDAGLIAAIEGDGVAHNTAPNPYATPVTLGAAR